LPGFVLLAGFAVLNLFDSAPTYPAAAFVESTACLELVRAVVLRILDDVALRIPIAAQ
jgi:hypothetical protein